MIYSYKQTEQNLPAHSHTISHTHGYSYSGTTGNESAHEGYSWTGSHTHGVMSRNFSTDVANECYPISSSGYEYGFATPGIKSGSGYSYITKGSRSGIQLLQSTSITVSGTCTGDHTHTFSGSGTTSSISTTSSGSTGSGTAISTLPPYEVAYCWKRIA